MEGNNLNKQNARCGPCHGGAFYKGRQFEKPQVRGPSNAEVPCGRAVQGHTVALVTHAIQAVLPHLSLRCISMGKRRASRLRDEGWVGVSEAEEVTELLRQRKEQMFRLHRRLGPSEERKDLLLAGVSRPREGVGREWDEMRWSCGVGRGQTMMSLVGQVMKFEPTHHFSCFPLFFVSLEGNFRVFSSTLEIHTGVML